MKAQMISTKPVSNNLEASIVNDWNEKKKMNQLSYAKPYKFEPSNDFIFVSISKFFLLILKLLIQKNKLVKIKVSNVIINKTLSSVC